MKQEKYSAEITCKQVDGNNQKPDPDEKRKVYDNIHGFIYLPQLIWDFIDTPHFQRLRRIKQLGCLQYVFPGATHSRFEHSIGTAYLARKFINLLIENNPSSYPKDKIEVQESARKTITLAGLLHDIGHGPYSHTFDGYIVTSIKKEGEEQSIKWTHQIASQQIFQHLVTSCGLGKHLTPQQVKRVRKLISGEAEGQRLWEFQIISNKINGIDVDKFDYFRRDAFYLGAKNIYVDHDLLMNQARIIDNQICYPTKYAETVYNIFHCRYKLYKNYYGNVVSKGIELMICDVLKEIQSSFKFQQACSQIFTDPSKYIKLSDNILEKVEDIWEDIKSNPDSKNSGFRTNFQKAVGILNRMYSRDIYKFVKQFHYYIREFSEAHIIQLFKQSFQKQTIAQYVSKDAKIDRDLICVSISDIGFGLKEANPLKKVGFFKKELDKLKKLDSNHLQNLSMLYTNAYVERSIKIFIKSNRTLDFNKVQYSFKKFCEQFNTKCQSQYEKSGLILICEGSGGKTPLLSPAQINTVLDSESYECENPVEGIEEEEGK